VITGGGTGGHVFPALALAEELRRRGCTVLFVGSRSGLEARLVPAKGIPFFTVRVGAVKNQGVLKIIKTFFTLSFSILWSLRFLHREKPAAVLGVGGYVSVPMCVAAFLTRRPLYLQEQNVSVGIANRFLGKLSRKVFIGFEQAKKSFSSKKTVLTGNPIRSDFYRADFPAHNPKGHCLLIVGGSQGARAINELIVSLLPLLSQNYIELSIFHQTGPHDLDIVKAAYEKNFKGPYRVAPFFDDMAAAYARASLVVARSGALTVSELIQVGRPAIFIPYPRQGQNDQTANAYFLQEREVARVVEQGDKFKERFWSVFQEVFQPETLGRMASHFSTLRQPNALVSIGDQIQKDLWT
jgi:UDP-N-acetylglucosamine--N-acetylmuramyl-(pentapeptide) pyrophosphoryl-undecaprenol N-acetylglucosamine transferase